jgi:hypothetical protein
MVKVLFIYQKRDLQQAPLSELATPSKKVNTSTRNIFSVFHVLSFKETNKNYAIQKQSFPGKERNSCEKYIFINNRKKNVRYVHVR